MKTNAKLTRDYGYYSIHAEAAALLRADGDTVVVARIHKNGDLSCAKPCDRCMKMLKDKGIKWVYYTDWDSNVKELRI